MHVARSSRPARTALTLVLSVLATTLGLALSAGPASADAYRYWGYYHLTDGAWAFADTGPEGFTPEDGSVEGYRFAVAGATDSRPPRAVPTFDDLCADTPAVDGSKRVGVLLDFGRDVDAAPDDTTAEPRTACAVVDAAATGDTVLAEVAELRLEGGLVCAIDGFPSTGCGDAVADADVTEQMAAADEPITLPAAGATPPSDTGQAGDVTTDAPTDPTDPVEQLSDGVPAWVWALVVLAVAGAVLGAIVMRSRTQRDEN